MFNKMVDDIPSEPRTDQTVVIVVFLRYLEKNLKIFKSEKKSGISGNIFRRFFVIFMSRPS